MPSQPDSTRAGPTRSGPKRSDPASCAEVDLLLEPYVDGELTGAEERRLELHVARCGGCAEELTHAREVTAELRRLPQLACPPAVTAAVLRHAGGDARHSATNAAASAASATNVAASDGGWRRRIAALLAPGPWSLRPAAAFAMAVLLVAVTAALVLPSLLAPPSDPATPQAQLPDDGAMTDAELAEAEREVKMAFAYLSQIGQQAGQQMAGNMAENVIRPTRRALGLPEELPADRGEGGSVRANRGGGSV